MTYAKRDDLSLCPFHCRGSHTRKWLRGRYIAKLHLPPVEEPPPDHEPPPQSPPDNEPPDPPVEEPPPVEHQLAPWISSQSRRPGRASQCMCPSWST
jgi:hypothetical protein